MSYQRPHITLSGDGVVISVFWSPPFEGPLRASAEDVPKYYAAYTALHDAIQVMYVCLNSVFKPRVYAARGLPKSTSPSRMPCYRVEGVC